MTSAGRSRSDGVMRKRLPAVAVVLCVAASSFLFIRHSRSLSVRRNSMDRLGERLAPVVAAVPPGRAIGFATDRVGDERKEIMHRLQFLLAPRVIIPDVTVDTVLVVDGECWLAQHPPGEVLERFESESGPICLVKQLRVP